ncbi:MAG: hypothetical protein FWB79_01355 [Treponema sp.]|nr:hypothetical protein [Treponema sp.]
MAKDKKKLMMELVTADVVSAIMEGSAVSAKEAMRLFYNSEVFERLCDPETGLYRESGGYVHELYRSWHMGHEGRIL